MVPTMALEMNLNRAAFRGGEWKATDFCADSLYLPQSDHSSSGEYGNIPRKQLGVKRTLRATNSVIETFLGTVHARSITSLQTLGRTSDLELYNEQDQHEYKTSYAIYPAPWMIRLGIHYGFHVGFLSSSTQGWKTALKPFNPVPDNALIFEFCREGNTSAVRKLLSGGHASIRDTDSSGYTPLHVSPVSKTNPANIRVVWMDESS